MPNVKNIQIGSTNYTVQPKINEKTVDGNTGELWLSISYVGTCTTSGSASVKIFNVGLDDDEYGLFPADGTIFGIKYTNTNTATTAPTIKFTARGGQTYTIWYDNAAVTEAASPYAGVAGRYIFYMKHGSYMVYLGSSYEQPGSSITVDSQLSSTSTNPVQNSTIYAAIGDIETLLSNI